MNHPKPEEWIPYVYGESPAPTRRALKAHLGSCPECRDQVGVLQKSCKQLDRWELPKPPSARGPSLASPRVMVAALLLLVAGFVAGRLGTPSAAQIRQRIEPGLRQAIVQDLANIAREQADQATESRLAKVETQSAEALARLVQEIQTQRVQDRRTVETTLERLETQRLTDLTSLKRELDILALNTDAGLRRTAEGLVQLAGYRAASDASDPSSKN